MINELIVYIIYCTGFISLLLGVIAIAEHKKEVKPRKVRRTYKRTYTNTNTTRKAA